VSHIGDLADTPVDIIRRVIDVNLVGAVLCARRAAQLMSTARGGAGGAIVDVNAVAPGIVDTEIHAAAGRPDRARTSAERIPLGRAAQADEITPAILWLLSPEAAYTTGAVIRVAGGL
jgi:NAD(P)-dependent dehydrogenase (short-subunit alcohol dehydrogenase family)